MTETVESFAPGAVVRLKSGGPAMTVERIGRFGGQIRVAVVWFEATQDHKGLFSPEALMAISPAEV